LDGQHRKAKIVLDEEAFVKEMVPSEHAHVQAIGKEIGLKDK